MKELRSRHGATARGLSAVAAAVFLRAACAAQTVYAKPGDTLSFPTPIVNATVDGAPGGDTINSMQLVIISTDGSGAVTNATPSATQSIAPGASVTFTPSFVVGNVPDGTYSFTLHMVSSDAGIIPDPDSAASDTQVTFIIDGTPPAVSAADDNNADIPDGTYTESPIVFLTVVDTGSGVATINFPGFEPYELNGTTVGTTVEFDNVDIGTNVVTVTDMAGNISTFTVIEGNGNPVLTLINYTTEHIFYSMVAGTAVPSGSDITPSTYNVSMFDPTGSGITDIQLSPGLTMVSCVPSLPLLPGSTNISCIFTTQTPGNMKFSVSSASGTTSVSWQAVQLTVAVDTTNSSIAFQAGQFEANIQLAVNAQSGIKNIQSFDFANPSQVDVRTNPDYPDDLSDLNLFSDYSISSRYYSVTDLQGNQVNAQSIFTTTIGANYSCASPTYPSGYANSAGTYSSDCTLNLSTGSFTSKYVYYNEAYPSGINGAILHPINPAAVIQYVGGYPLYSGSQTTYLNGVEIYSATCGITPDATTGVPVEFIRYTSNQTSFPLTLPAQVHTVLNVTAPSGMTAPYPICGGAYFNGFGIPIAAASITNNPVYSQTVSQFYPGVNQTVPLGPGAFLSNLTATSAGTFLLATMSTELFGAYIPNQEGFPTIPNDDNTWTDANGGIGYFLSSGGNQSTTPFWSGSFNLTVPFNNTAPATSADQPVQVLFSSTPFESAVGGPWQTLTPVSSGTVTLPGPGWIRFVVPTHIYTNTVSLDGLTILSNNSNVTLAEASSNPYALEADSALGATGFVPTGPTVIAGPSGLTFNPAAYVTYTPPSQVTSGQLVQASLTDGSLSFPNGLAYNSQTNTYSGFVSQLHSLFGVFVASTPVPAVDLIPPQTSVLLGAASVVGSTQTTIVEGTPVGFSALDPPFPGAPTSGIAQTYYLLDTPFISTTATPGSPIPAAPFLLNPGAHSLSYYSVDKSSNVEHVNVSTITVMPSARDFGGLGLNVDTSGNLWEVFSDSGVTGFALENSSGVMIGSTTLPNVDQAFPLSVAFDASGNPYAVGAALGSNGADLVAVFKASTTGTSLLSSTTFDSGWSNNNLVFASTAGWIVGAVQTAGPISTDAPGARAYSMAIWKINPTTGLISLTTTYSRAGFDVATGLAVDGSGDLWITGYSEEPSPRSTLVFDLALWKYASDGQTLLHSPYHRTGYLSDFDTSQTALVTLSSSTVFVAAPRGVPGQQTNLAFVAFSTGGALIAESSWQPGDGSSAYPGAIFTDNSGNLVVPGGEVYATSVTVAGLWRYSASGILNSVTQTAAMGARAAATNGNGLWLAVDGSSSPYLDSAETSFNGGFADIEPPRTSLVISTPPAPGGPVYVSSTTPISLVAVDDAYAVGDDLGVGAQYTYFSIDSSSYTAYNSTFSLVAEGTHTVTFYSIDYAGNAEVVESSTVVVDSTPPTALFITSGTAYAITAADALSNGVASGVAGIYYTINESFSDCAGAVISTTNSPGTCSNPFYSGPFSLSSGTYLIYYAAYDVAGNFSAKQSTVVVVGVPGPSIPPINLSTAVPSVAYAGEILTATATGSGYAASTALQLVRINPASGAWASTSLLSQARKQGTLTTLLNGTVIAAGGVNASSAALSSTELFDPALQEWFPLPAMNAARSQFNAVALNNGNLLVIGGNGSAGTAIATAEIYSPSSGTWTTTGSMTHARAQQKSVLLPNGKVLTVGGNSSGALSTCELYNPNTGSWSSVASLHTARYLETLTVLNDGTVLAAGGTSGSSALSSAEVYSSTANAWTAVGSMAHARDNHAAALLNNGSVLVSGGAGSSPVATAEIYSSTAEVWSSAPSMNTARTLHAIVVTGQGVPFAIGGENSTNGELSSVEYYDQQLKTWTYSASLPTTRDYVRAVTLDNGDLLVAGVQSGGQPVSSSTLYTPSLAAVSAASSNVQVDTADVAGGLNLAGAATGYWAVVVQNPDGRQGMLVPGVQVFADTSAPVTTLLLDGVATTSTTLSLRVSDTLGLVAIDTGSGVAQTLYSLDGASTAAFVSAFTVAVGTHVLTYQSVDRAGNWEALHVDTVTVADPVAVSGAGGGLGVGVDPFGTLWSVATTSGAVSLASFPGEVFAASSTLINADPAYPWNVIYDTTGASYAVGSAIGTNGADLVALYAASADGDAIVSTRTYDSGYSNNNLVFAAANNWVVGSVQTSGPISLSSAGARSYSLAIWSVSPSSGLIQLTTSYTRAGFDVGTGLAVDGSGNLWISGFSQSPTSVSTNVFDLAVWEFAPDGKTLLAGPLIQPGYLPEFDTSKIAAIALSNGNIAVAAPRADASSGTALGFVLLTSTNQVLAESSWQPADGSALLPSGLVLDASGRPDVTGSFDYPNGTEAGIWRYNSAGTQTSAAQVDAGGVHGAKFDLTGNFWFAVDGSTTPVLDAGEAAAPGSLVDVAPPRTTLNFDAPSYSSGTVLYATSATTFSLTAVDDRSLPPGDGLGVGVTATKLAIDTTTFAVYSGTFSLVAEGTHTIEFYSVDRDSNAEVVHTSSVAVDLTDPITSLLVLGSSGTVSGAIEISTRVALSLSPVDPISNGVASGVAETYYVIDENPFSPGCESTALSTSAPNGTCANEAYDGAFTLSAGTHTVYYFSEDEVGNQETVNVASFSVINGSLPPRSSLTWGTPSCSTSTVGYVSGETPFTLTAVDDLETIGDGLGAGIAYSEVIVDSNSYALYSGSFTMTLEGLDTIYYYSVDLESNTEVTHSTMVAVDLTPPITLLQPQGPSGNNLYGAITVSSTTSLALSATDPVSNGVASGPAVTYYVVDTNPFSPTCESTPFDSSAPNGTCANEAYDGTFTLALGTHTVYYFSEDNVGNQELVNITSVTAATDILPPRTTLDVSTPSFSTGTLTYVSDASTFSMTSVDDQFIPGDGDGVGVDAVYVAIDTMTFSSYSGTFSLVAEGTHTIEFYGIDLDSNVEVAHSSMVAVDLTPPITSLQIAGFSTTSSGTVVVSTDNSITLPAVDPISNGVASGVAETYYVVDVNPFSSGCESTPFNSAAPNGTCANEAYAGAFTLALGTHTVYYFSEDAVGNQEIVDIASVTVSDDIQPPRTSISFGVPSYSSGTDVYLDAFTPISLTAVDDLLAVGDGIGLGVADIYVSIDSAAFTVYSGTFSISTEGWHTVTFFSVDIASNTEIQHSSAAAVDMTAPVTSLQLTGPSDPTSDNGYTVSTTTVFSLSAIDPVSNGAASGVAETYYVVDTDPFSSGCVETALSTSAPNGTCANEAYDGGFSLAVGTHTIYFFSEDEVGNQETENISSVTVSTGCLPDVTGISPSSGPIGTAFLITGTGFGAYSSTASLVDFNGVPAPISVWLDTAVAGNIPGTLSSGTASVVIQNVTDGFVVQSTAPVFLVDVPYISTITPTSGAGGTGVMIGGYGFGSYNGSATELLVAGSSASLSVWIDTEIVWTVPTSISPSTVSVVVSLTPPGGSETSNSVSFDVTSGGGGGHAFGLFGSLAGAPVSLSAMPDWYFLGDMLLPAASGGTIHTPSGASLVVPPYTVAKNTQFTMTHVNEIDQPSLAMSISQQKLTPAGQAVAFGPTNAALARPVTLILPYDPTLVTAAQLGTLEIYYFDPSENMWNALPTTVQTNSHVLTTQTSHFSLYQPLMLAPLVSGGGAFDVFGLRTSYAFPNPSNHGAAVDFRLETGLADSVDLHVYNTAGRRVLSTSLGAVNFITDPTLGQQDSYDYVWDVSGVGSGVYTYVFVAHKSGEHDVIATGKVGVIK